MKKKILHILVIAAIAVGLFFLSENFTKPKQDYSEYFTGYDDRISFIVEGYQMHWDGFSPEDLDLSYIYKYESPYGGFAKTDLDGDGTEELLLGDQFENGNYQIYDIYTFDKTTGNIIHLFCGGERNWCTFNGSGVIIETGSNSAFDSFTKYYVIKNLKLKKLGRNRPITKDLFIPTLDKFINYAKPLCGGYTKQRELTEEDMALFRKVMGDTAFTPLSVATQVVAGLNHRFWCRYDDGSKDSPAHRFITIYQPLQGEPVISKIQNENGGAEMINTDCPSVRKAHASVSEANLRRNVEFLSSDECQGRLPFTPGADRAVQYLADEMKSIGLTPGYDGSYLQQVPLVMMNLQPSDQMAIATPSGELIFKNRKDFTAFTSSKKEDVTIDGSELIFAGYGIVAEEFGKNDYDGLTNPQNKVAVVFVNDPGLGSDTDYFTGDAMTYYGRWTYKYEEGARQGLKGVLIIHDDRGAGYGWGVVQASENIKYVLDDPEVDTEGCPLQGWLSNDAARKLLAKCGYDMDALKEKAKRADFRPFPLNSSVSVSIHSSFTGKSSPNVVGYIPGSRRNGENIVCVAHWDHLGMIDTKEGEDGIYNGATDNATAMAWLLETAKAFKDMGVQPERDIVFLLPTCEEKGMFGSEYYVTHPVSPIEKTVAVINLDVIPLWGENNDVTITGYGHSDLDERVAKFATKYGRYVMPDPEAYNGMFYRSDHLPFMRRGVPAMFAKGWSDNREHGRKWSEAKIKDYWANTYHTVRDQTHPLTDDYSGLVQEVHLFIDLIHSLAFSQDWPEWNKSSEFQRR